MLKKHKNELLQIIQDEGIALSQIKKTEDVISDHPAVIIEIIGTPLKFIVRHSVENYEWFDCNFTQFNSTFSATGFLPDDTDYCSFIDVRNMFKTWLRSHVKEYFAELTTPDLWTQFASDSKMLNLSTIDFEDKDFFNTEEKQQIRLALRDVRLLIVDQFSPSAPELESIDARLDYLSQAVDRLNKFDWKSLLISTIMSISVALSFDTEKGRQLYTLFKQVFDVIPKLFY